MTVIRLAPNKNRRIENGHPWVYANEVAKIDGKPQIGEIVHIENHKGKFVGKGYYNPNSLICTRILSRNPQQKIDFQFFRNQIEQAKQYREHLGFKDTYRLVFGEADFLPALVIDKFKDYFVVQSMAYGIDQYKTQICQALAELFAPKGIYERNDVPVRELEGLPQQTGYLLGDFPTDLIIEENQFKFQIDIANGQKTGYFLDQTENRASIAPFVKDRTVLDCFCHTAPFAVHAAGYGAKKVIALDISQHAINSAKQNADLNQLTNIEFVVANAFDWLKDIAQTNTQFDTVILDPPAFTKSRGNIQNALRGYKEINLRGMKLTKKGGFLITCTCSHFIKPEVFREVLAEAAIDAGRQIREVMFKTQGKDHPILWGVDETLYLKFYVLQVL